MNRYGDIYVHNDLNETVDINVDGKEDGNDNIGGDRIFLLTELMKFAIIKMSMVTAISMTCNFLWLKINLNFILGNNFEGRK